MNLAMIEKKLAGVQRHYQELAAECRRERKELKRANRQLANCLAARNIAQYVAQAVQQTSHEQIAKIVTGCLEAIFGDGTCFQLVFERKRGRTEARMLFERNGLVMSPKGMSGGSVVDVASLALRIANIVLAHPKVRKLAVLDEPFLYLSPYNRAKVGNMIHTLSKELGIQFILTTPDPARVIGKVIEIGR